MFLSDQCFNYILVKIPIRRHITTYLLNKNISYLNEYGFRQYDVPEDSKLKRIYETFKGLPFKKHLKTYICNYKCYLDPLSHVLLCDTLWKCIGDLYTPPPPPPPPTSTRCVCNKWKSFNFCFSSDYCIKEAFLATIIDMLR